MRITATGNVGIGTAAPTERLQVSDGNVAITNTDNTARQLRLYEPSGAGTNFTAFRAQAQAKRHHLHAAGEPDADERGGGRDPADGCQWEPVVAQSDGAGGGDVHGR
jgi:hypothetical protein